MFSRTYGTFIINHGIFVVPLSNTPNHFLHIGVSQNQKTVPFVYIYISLHTYIYILCKTKNIHNSITTSFTTFYHHNVNRTPPFFFCQLISPGANCEAWRWSEGSGFHGKIIEDHRSKWANFGAMMSFMPFLGSPICWSFFGFWYVRSSISNYWKCKQS